MKQLTMLVFAIAWLFSTLCRATTWGDAEVDDPIEPAVKCKVHEPHSYGGYIYSWSSKYDQVFWPLTDVHGIWQCEKTGFTAFINDFKNIAPSERDSIRQYLKSHYKSGGGMEEKLRMLEGVYALRSTDEQFKIRLLRVLARWYQELGFPDKANVYRKKALERIQQSLMGKIPEAQKLEYLYVSANYTRLFGDAPTSDRYIGELSAAIKKLEDKSLSGFADYISELVKETPRIVPGGILDPKK